MRIQFPELITLALKKNVQLGVRMEVHTLLCTLYHQMTRQSENPFTLTSRSAKGGISNEPQWKGFSELVKGRTVLVYSLTELENFWPAELVEGFRVKSRSRILELSDVLRIFFPGMSFQSFSDASEKLAQYVPDDIASSEDAIMSLFLKLSTYVCSLELKSRQDAAALLHPDKPAVSDWINKLRLISMRQVISRYNPPDNIRAADDEDTKVAVPLSQAYVEGVFADGGPASTLMNVFEKRPEQVKYAKRYTLSLQQGQYFLAEAGTGTGKSLAYLIPALLYSSEHGKSALISTHTRSLQTQLFYKDLVQAEEIIGKKFSSVLLKGRSNYVCLLRMHIARANATRNYDAQHLADLASVLIWKDITKSGDLSELSGLSTRVRRDVECDPGFCPGSQCSHYSRCFLFRVRRAVPRADIIVTNHALFFSDVMADTDILGSPGAVVFDEAHQIDKVATDMLTGELSRSTLSGIFEPLQSDDPGMPDRLSSLTGLAVRRADDDETGAALRESGNECSLEVSKCQRSIGRLFAEVDSYVASRNLIPSDYSRRERLNANHQLLQLIDSSLFELFERFRNLEQKLGRMVDHFDSAELEMDEILLVETVAGVVQSLRQYLIYIDNLREADDESWVRWLEVTTKGWVSLKIAPVEIAEILNKTVYEKHERILFTSATMTVDKDFSYIEDRLGINRLDEGKVKRSVFGSSFDYRSQMRFICSAYLPSPRTDYYQKKLSQFLKTLFMKLDSSTMVLFTSYQSLKSTVSDLGGRFPRLVVQDSADAADRALADFRQLKPAILFGTDSFWQGIDLPGELLEVLVITRLPFSVPGDPIDSARMELIEKRGGNSFAEYSLPTAVLRFKQGFGRLIRTSLDEGVVLVTDSRLVKSSFGQVFLNSVPAEVVITSCWDEVEREIDSILRK